LQIKTYNKYEHEGSKIVVTECQRDRMDDYIEGGEFVEMRRKHTREYDDVTKEMMEDKITFKDYDRKRLSIFTRMMGDYDKKRY
jgi:hypothetical protein